MANPPVGYQDEHVVLATKFLLLDVGFARVAGCPTAGKIPKYQSVNLSVWHGLRDLRDLALPAHFGHFAAD